LKSLISLFYYCSCSRYIWIGPNLITHIHTMKKMHVQFPVLFGIKLYLATCSSFSFHVIVLWWDHIGFEEADKEIETHWQRLLSSLNYECILQHLPSSIGVFGWCDLCHKIALIMYPHTGWR